MEQLDLPAVSGDAPIVGPLGEISVRFVVFKKKVVPTKSSADDKAGDDDETADSAQEINSYLEAPTHGRQHVVFLLNGQRHHSMDRGFIVHDLGKKYISKRTLIIVELEGLTREAKARLIQGSRSGFYEAEVFHRIKARLVALLKRDPDLERLEDEAEEELSRLQASDEDVHLALDQLIEEHNPFADHSAQTGGPDAAGKSNGVIIAHVGKATPLNVVVRATEGDLAAGPLLIGRNSPKTLRLRPNEQKQITLFSDPPDAWAHLTKIGFVMDPALEELKVTIDSTPEGSKVSFLYSPPTEDQEYPVATAVRFFGGFNGSSEPRLFEQDIVIKPRTDRPPPPEPVLLDVPTQLRLRSRKPIKLLLGDADRHVVLQWDGKDELVNGLTPSWMLRVFCTTHPGYPAVTVTQPHKGRFEAVVPCPQDRTVFGPGTSMVFQAEAIGRGGKTLSIQFEAIVEDSVPPVDENGPRLSSVTVPLAGDRKPNYQIVEISEEKYGEIECPWGDAWDTSKAGAFIEPREKKPVVLIVNVDHDLYKQFMAQELKGKPAESTIKRQRTRYIAHICYYLYQMFLSQQNARPAATGAAESPTEPTDERNIQEINRVAKMLIRLMPMMH